jgi:hypothetical protein
MFNKQSLLIAATFVFTSLLGVSDAHAQGTKCYTLASLQGSYSVVGTYGANVGVAIGVGVLDGNGNLTRTSVVNGPTAGSSTGARTITTTVNVGTYTVNCDGTGKFNRILTLADGSTSIGVDDFVITGAVVQGGRLLATTIVDAQQIPSAVIPGGVFLTRVHTRLPDFGPSQAAAQ